MEDEELDQIALDYLESLPNKDVTQDTFKVDKLAVGFAGIPGSGKTELSKLIEDRRNALRISSSEVRQEIRAEFPDVSTEELNEAKQRVVEHLIELIDEEPNNLIVLDMSLDRTYERMDELLEGHGYQTIVVSVEIDPDEAKERIRNRTADYEEYEPHFEAWEEQHEEFLDNYHQDLSINGMSPDHEAILQLIDRHLHNKKGNEPDSMDDLDESSAQQKPTQPEP